MKRRAINVPSFYVRKFPEKRGQTLDQFLEKMQKLRAGEKVMISGHVISEPWRGYDKTPEKERRIIWARIYKWLGRKAKHLEAMKSERWVSGTVMVVREKGRFVTWIPVERVVRPAGELSRPSGLRRE
jgi:hypothetical protein